MKTQNQKGIAMVEVVVVVIVNCVLLALIPALKSPSALDYRIKCATNLKGLGTALMCYGLDYNNEYPVVGGENAPWSRKLGWNYDFSDANYFPGGTQENSPRSITACWYLLVRETDVHPVTFLCKETPQVAYKIKGTKNYLEIWDFGTNPYQHVSYALQNPFGKFPATRYRNPAAAVAADMSPWFKDGDIVPHASGSDAPQLIDPADSTTHTFGNSLNHGGEGQNVLFGDGHVEYLKSPNVGVDKDNIYTYWSNEVSPTDTDKQVGVNPTARDKDNDSKDAADSFLAI